MVKEIHLGSHLCGTQMHLTLKTNWRARDRKMPKCTRREGLRSIPLNGSKAVIASSLLHLP